MIKSQLMRAQLPMSFANAICGFVSGGLGGSTTISQATAAICPNDSNVFTVGTAATCCILGAPAVGSTLDMLNVGDEVYIANFTAFTLSVFPPVGGKINNGTLNAAITLATNTSGHFRKLTLTDYGWI